MQRRLKIEEGQMVGVWNGLQQPYGDTRAGNLEMERGGQIKQE